MSCAGRELEKRRREAIDGIVHLSQTARAKILLGVRESVKEGMTIDPDMSEGQKQGVRDFVDWIWKTVVILTEFKTAAGVKGSRAAIDYEENRDFGYAPTFPGLSWVRAKILYAYMPFDRTVNGKMKNPFFIFLSAISFIPFYCVRLVFFFLLLMLHLAGRPPDTYQIIEFVFSMKGTQFKSGGVILAVYGIYQYLSCATPGDANACEAIGAGYNISKAMSVADVVGSFLLGWFAFFMIARSKVHMGEDSEHLMPSFESITESMQLAGFDQAKSTDTIHRCFPACLRLPPCVASVRSVSRCLEPWPPGGTRVFVLLLYDLFGLCAALGYGWWLVRFDVATAQVEAGLLKQAIHYDFDALKTWWSTPQANITIFHVRVCYHMLTMPFIIFMAPGVSTVLGLTARTGYNKQGYCVPFTLRPLVRASRWACEPPQTAAPPGARTFEVAGAAPLSGDRPEKAGGRAACAPRQCGF